MTNQYRHFIIIEERKITHLWCHQHTLGDRNISCAWVANPNAQFYKIVFTNLENSNSFKMNVSKEYVNIELDTDMGNIIGIIVNTALTKVLLKG